VCHSVNSTVGLSSDLNFAGNLSSLWLSSTSRSLANLRSFAWERPSRSSRLSLPFWGPFNLHVCCACSGPEVAHCACGPSVSFGSTAAAAEAPRHLQGVVEGSRGAAAEARSPCAPLDPRSGRRQRPWRPRSVPTRCAPPSHAAAGHMPQPKRLGYSPEVGRRAYAPSPTWQKPFARSSAPWRASTCAGRGRTGAGREVRGVDQRRGTPSLAAWGKQRSPGTPRSAVCLHSVAAPIARRPARRRAH
jgi:hypothetical protein